MKMAVTEWGEEAAANEVWHVAVYVEPVSTTGWPVHPEIALPLSTNSTLPVGVDELGPTVAVSVTGWLVTAVDGLGGDSAVVVPPATVVSTVAVTLLAV
jgi:hypothetical protein